VNFEMDMGGNIFSVMSKVTIFICYLQKSNDQLILATIADQCSVTEIIFESA
jgi:hypothetical protein